MAENIFDGVPELDIISADPMFFDKIEGNLRILKYTLYNSTMTGYKNCMFRTVK